KEIQDKAKELKSKENELQAKIEQHEKHIQNLELGHERALKELPPELLKIAQEMMKKINLAYEIIKETRGA
ncbi:hypothetical protein VWM73_12850, partial [Campylobacter coli]